MKDDITGITLFATAIFTVGSLMGAAVGYKINSVEPYELATPQELRARVESTIRIPERYSGGRERVTSDNFGGLAMSKINKRLDVLEAERALRDTIREAGEKDLARMASEQETYRQALILSYDAKDCDEFREKIRERCRLLERYRTRISIDSGAKLGNAEPRFIGGTP
jgi:hypothetical protein